MSFVRLDGDELAHCLRTSIPIFACFSLPFYTKSTPRSPLYSDKPPASFPFVFIHSFTLNPSALLLHIPVYSRSHVTRHTGSHTTPGRSRSRSQVARTFALASVQNISLVDRIECNYPLHQVLMLSGHLSHLRGHRSRFRRVTRPYKIIYSLQQLIRTHTDRLLFRWPCTAHNSSGRLIHTAYHSSSIIWLILVHTDSYRWPTARPNSYSQATLQADLYLTPSTLYAFTRSPVTCTTSLLQYMTSPLWRL